MSHSTLSASAGRRRRWPLILYLALAIALAAGWSGLWFFAAARAKAEIAEWRELERRQGRLQDCASQSLGGFPFRIEVRCNGAIFQMKGTPTQQLKLPFALAAVQIYDPKLLISEFTGPLEVSERDRAPGFLADWTLGQASVRGLPSEVQRASLALDGLTVRDLSIAGNDPVFRAQHLELHGRPAAGSASGNPLIETVLRLGGAVAEKLHPMAAQPIDADITTVLRGMTDVSPEPWPVRLKGWQARDGQIEIIKARIAQADVIAAGAGTLRLTARGGLDGNLQVTVVGIETILKAFDLERVMSEGQIGATLSALDRLIPGLGGMARQNSPGLVAALGQRTVLEGKPAVAFPIRFADGAVFLGPFQVGVVPPLF